MSNSKRFFVCLILSLLLPKSTSAQIVDQRDDMNWTFFMAVTWTVEPIQDLNFIMGIHMDEKGKLEVGTILFFSGAGQVD